MAFQSQLQWVERHRPHGTVFGLVLSDDPHTRGEPWVATLYQPDEAGNLSVMFTAVAYRPDAAMRYLVQQMKQAGF